MTDKRRGELYRNSSQGKIAGVCAGLADYFGWETWLVRILVVSGVLLGMGWFVVIYIAGWFILDKKPGVTAKKSQPTQSPYASATKHTEEELSSESIKVKSRIWQSGEPPKQAFQDIRHKFKSLEREVRAMEHYVTSPEFTVSREINKL
ncbi:envelope stress response membrane protein PspC [Colwellia hornerae]|uniref:Envelope stress response membrane protein PspC n=1 Tax=Colwellia hornerae TaxID=89402 RepID=A0A5C6QEM4_9GAMM|nr:envelope stress response membrane protein PspC [Colwellia hornerae]TWX52621.1 envelope stress response membrane protein PspC [Colwellia hornerae]TWX58384.1 envelope stress response membrane protein PspC [Colwellia hornerae]TWX67436.1 envelope stress response membrane protein PspC [Colwellia hornerae]